MGIGLANFERNSLRVPYCKPEAHELLSRRCNSFLTHRIGNNGAFKPIVRFPAGINYRPFIRRPFQMQVWIQRTKQRCLREVNDLKEDDRNAFPLCTQAPDSVTVSVKMCKMRRWNIHRFVDAPQSRAVAKRIQSVPMCKKRREVLEQIAV